MPFGLERTLLQVHTRGSRNDLTLQSIAIDARGSQVPLGQLHVFVTYDFESVARGVDTHAYALDGLLDESTLGYESTHNLTRV